MKKMKEQKRLLRAMSAEYSQMTRQFNVIQAKMAEVMTMMRNLTKPHTRKQTNGVHRLGLRQRQVFNLIGKNKSELEIAKILGISRKTVNNTKTQMAKKLGLNSARDLKLLARASVIKKKK